MAYAKLKSTVLYVTDESTEGTAVDPTLGTQAVGILADGFSMDGEKELVERSLLRSGIMKQVPRTGIKTSVVSLAVEASANSNKSNALYRLNPSANAEANESPHKAAPRIIDFAILII